MTRRNFLKSILIGLVTAFLFVFYPPAIKNAFAQGMDENIVKAIHGLQLTAIVQGNDALEQVRAGTISDQVYLDRRFEDVSFWYSKQMVRLGLSNKHDEVWIRSFASHMLAGERDIAPLDEFGMTERRRKDLKFYYQEEAYKFFVAYHTKFCPSIDPYTIAPFFKNSTRMKAELNELLKENPDHFKTL